MVRTTLLAGANVRRAFLCHSSEDKHYVRIIAHRLGRAKIVFDEMSFEPGQDFRDEIQKYLGGTSLFVFIASKSSLNSLWCQYELDQAHLKKLAGEIEGQLVLIIDKDVTFAELPEWLQNAKAIIQTRPAQATRDVQNALLAVLPAEFEKPFVGRQSLQKEFIHSLRSSDLSIPRVFTVSGLEGIGRRSYLRRVCKDNLGLSLGPFTLLDSTRGLEEVYLWLLDETTDTFTREKLAEEIQTFQKLSGSQKIEEIIKKLLILCSHKCIPCLVDQGGILDDSGRYKEEYSALFRSFLSFDEDQYLAIVHRRSPYIYDLDFHVQLVKQYVTPLSQDETGLLLQQVLRKADLGPSHTEIEEVSEYVDGYPPAAYFVSSFAKEYGLQTLIADKSVLVDFKAKRFSRFIGNLRLSDLEWGTLRYLASEQLIPLSAIAVALEVSMEEAAVSVRNLIDHSLLIVLDENYALSGPTRDAIIRAKGHLPTEFYKGVRKRLTKEFWVENKSAPTVEIVDATLHSVARSGSTDFNPYEDLVRVATVHRLAQECYYRKEWPDALEYARRAEEMDPQRKDVSVLHFKALVQMEKWEEAESQLAKIRTSGHPHALYLKGFMLRRRGMYEKAVETFESALKSGDYSYPVHRDLADCLHRCERYSEAYEKIKWVLDRDSENIFALDLFIRICIADRRFAKAKQWLSVLEGCDLDKRFVHHRKSTYYASQNMLEKALVEAETALQTGHSPFEAYAQRVDVLVELGKYQDAMKALEELHDRFGNQRRDVQLGLRAKLLIREGNWQAAKAAWDRITTKSKLVHQVLLLRILSLKAQDGTLSLKVRQDAQKEADSLTDSLRKHHSTRSIAENDDEPDTDVESLTDDRDSKSGA